MSENIAEAAVNAAESLRTEPPQEEPSYEVISLAPVPDNLPPRPWLIDGLLMDGNVTMLTGRGGDGKSLLALQLAITTALGATFAWWPAPQKRKVLLLNAEDDLDEQRRRLLSACAVMGAEVDVLAKHLSTLNTQRLVLLARNPDTGKIERTHLYNKLFAIIKQYEIGLLVIDPLIETHAYLDENSNVDMKEVIVALRDLARRCAIPVLVVHHSRKGAPGGDQDGARGGSALVNACRMVVTLDRMDGSAHEKIRPPLPKENYVRVTGAKANYAGRIGDHWLEIRSVQLQNGDSSPGLKRVDFDELEEGFDPHTWDHREAFLKLVREGRGDGLLWSPAETGKKEARLDAAVAECFKLNAAKAKEIIKHFSEASLIQVEERKDTHRKLYKVWVEARPEKRDPLEVFK